MFDKTQYVIEPKITSSFLRFISPLASLALRETYNIKDKNGNLLGYAKKKRLSFKPKFWFEGKDGTHHGEIRKNHGYEIYDAQNRLRATIKMAPTKKGEGRRFLLGLILAVMPMIVFVAVLVLSLAVPSFSQVFNIPGEGSPAFLILLISCPGLTILGLILFGYFAVKGRFGKPKWLIENPEGQQLAEGNDFSLSRHLKILAPDGGVIARVHTKRGLPASRRINISRHNLDSLLILSYTIVMLHRSEEAVSSAASGFG
jgi:hypothetical protein